VRSGPMGPEVLLVTARESPEQWIFPKGHIEANETSQSAAQREAREEAGALGDVLFTAGDLRFEQRGHPVCVTYFVLQYSGSYPATERRSVAWYPLHRALQVLAHEDARALLFDISNRLYELTTSNT